MFMVDEDMTMQVFNDQYLQLFDLPEEAVKIGGSLEVPVRLRAERGDYGPGDIDNLVAQRLKGYTDHDNELSEETLPSGRTIEFHRRPTNEGGVVAVATDITKRHMAEQEINRQKQLLELTMENMDQAIGMWDGDFKLVAFNDKLKQIIRVPDALMAIGTPAEAMYRYIAESRGFSSDDDFGADDVDTAVSARMASLRSKESKQYEAELPDGRTFEIRRNVVATGGLVTTYSDVTERKRAERQLADAFTVISSSIEYASNIQRAALPFDDLMANAGETEHARIA
jgi:PAS domain-containing protein